MSFEHGFAIISEILFVLYLVCAAYQDCRERLVVRGTHLMGLAAVGIYCLPAAWGVVTALYGGAGIAADGDGGAAFRCAASSAHCFLYDTWCARTAVLLICLLCEGIYRHFSLYGLADSLVFLNCALYCWVRTDAFMAFFLFWWLKAFSGFLFLAVQLLRRRRLCFRLSEPTAYIPYILCAFALTNITLKRYTNWY